MNRLKLKSYFKTGKKPTQEQFEEWIDACWFRGEKINICDVKHLTRLLAQKADVENIQFIIDNHIGGIVELPVHSLCGSANITEKLEIAGVAYNRNCSSLYFMDKQDIDNTLIVHLRELDEEEDDDFEVEPISLEKFYNTSVYIFASEIEKGRKVDVSLALRNVIEPVKEPEVK